MIIRNSVVLPAPLAPITPTMPPRGSENDEVLDQQPVAEALAQVLGLDDDVAEPRPGRDVDLDLVELDVALLGDQLLVAGQARLRLRLAALRVLAHPLELRGDRARRAVSAFSSCCEALLLLLEPARVVALERDALAAVELEDPAGDVVEEVAVVGDGDDGALVLLEVPLEPGDRLGVEVVRRLVEQQQVGRASSRRQSATRRRSPPESSSTSASAGGQAQRVHRAVERGVEVPGVGGVDLLLQVGELVGGLVGVVGGELVEAVEQRRGLARRRPRRCRGRPCRRSSCGSCSSRPTVAPGASCASPRNSCRRRP